MRVIKIKHLLLLLLCIGCIACSTEGLKLADGVKYPDSKSFEKTINEKQVALYTLTNANGMRVDVTNHGARLVAIFAPDRDGVFDDVVLGYHTIDEFLVSGEPYLGTVIGRYGNRIGNAQFSLDGKVYELAANNGPNNLHGGPGGYHNVVWDVESYTDSSIVMTYLSPHLEEGFPGNLSLKHTITLNSQNGVELDYYAITDKPTVVNLTNHAFFNMAGEGAPTVLNHQLAIYADYFTPVDSTLIPTGELQSVEGTPFDFRRFTAIGERIEQDDQQLKYGIGYDHNYVLNQSITVDGLTLAASIYDPESGRKLNVLTTEPAIQLYTGNFLTGNEVGKKGKPYPFRSAFCLETQHYPDSPNKPHFPSTRLNPGQEYSTKTIYQFTVVER